MRGWCVDSGPARSRPSAPGLTHPEGVLRRGPGGALEWCYREGHAAVALDPGPVNGLVDGVRTGVEVVKDFDLVGI